MCFVRAPDASMIGPGRAMGMCEKRSGCCWWVGKRKGWGRSIRGRIETGKAFEICRESRKKKIR